jgi:4-oxalocrotonate tautomerase
MPFARLTLTPALAPERASRLAAELTDLVAASLGKRHDLTSVLIETPGETLWTIGGHPRATAAHLEVCVTAGTNSDEEKRTFVANAMRTLKEALPGLDPATYVIVKEMPGSDWGFDGRTQADRARERS